MRTANEPDKAFGCAFCGKRPSDGRDISAVGRKPQRLLNIKQLDPISVDLHLIVASPEKDQSVLPVGAYESRRFDTSGRRDNPRSPRDKPLDSLGLVIDVASRDLRAAKPEFAYFAQIGLGLPRRSAQPQPTAESAEPRGTVARPSQPL